MDLSHLLVFAAAYFMALVLPGPGVTALVARVMARGLAGVVFFIAGFVVASLLWFGAAALGLALVAARFAPLFTAIRLMGAGYLLYLAWRMWRSPGRSGPGAAVGAAVAGEDRARLFLAGLAINLGNPKVIVFFLALLPTVVNLPALTPLGFAELAGIVAVVVSSVLGGYALAAAWLMAYGARHLFASPRAMRWMNRAGGAVMAGVAVSIAAR